MTNSGDEGSIRRFDSRHPSVPFSADAPFPSWDLRSAQRVLTASPEPPQAAPTQSLGSNDPTACSGPVNSESLQRGSEEVRNHHGTDSGSVLFRKESSGLRVTFAQQSGLQESLIGPNKATPTHWRSERDGLQNRGLQGSSTSQPRSVQAHSIRHDSASDTSTPTTNLPTYLEVGRTRRTGHGGSDRVDVDGGASPLGCSSSDRPNDRRLQRAVDPTSLAQGCGQRKGENHALPGIPMAPNSSELPLVPKTISTHDTAFSRPLLRQGSGSATEIFQLDSAFIAPWIPSGNGSSGCSPQVNPLDLRSPHRQGASDVPPPTNCRTRSGDGGGSTLPLTASTRPSVSALKRSDFTTLVAADCGTCGKSHLPMWVENVVDKIHLCSTFSRSSSRRIRSDRARSKALLGIFLLYNSPSPYDPRIRFPGVPPVHTIARPRSETGSRPRVFPLDAIAIPTLDIPWLKSRFPKLIPVLNLIDDKDTFYSLFLEGVKLPRKPTRSSLPSRTAVQDLLRWDVVSPSLSLTMFVVLLDFSRLLIPFDYQRDSYQRGPKTSPLISVSRPLTLSNDGFLTSTTPSRSTFGTFSTSTRSALRSQGFSLSTLGSIGSL